jgi:hypothetical protein
MGDLWQLFGQTDINMEIGNENLGGLATRRGRMMNSHQRSSFSGVLKETEEREDQETAGEDPL